MTDRGTAVLWVALAIGWTAFVILVTATLVSGPAPEPVRLDRGAVTVQEDESGWDCRTMGNGVCG